jgi:branched-chain amino acid transport system ATP-binding protein
MSGPLLRVADLHAGYGRMPVLRGVCLAIAKREAVGVIGANGAGKTTLLRTISGVNRRWAGQIEFDGREIGRLAAQKLIRIGLAHVPQDRHVFPDLTVRENLLIGATSQARRMRADAAGRAARWLERFPVLAARADHRAGVLSGGEQQILVICRALMAQPALILLDEPSLGLSPTARQSCFALLSELRREGTALLIVDQDLTLLGTVADRIYHLRRGTVERYEHGSATPYLTSVDRDSRGVGGAGLLGPGPLQDPAGIRVHRSGRPGEPQAHDGLGDELRPETHGSLPEP